MIYAAKPLWETFPSQFANQQYESEVAVLGDNIFIKYMFMFFFVKVYRGLSGFKNLWIVVWSQPLACWTPENIIGFHNLILEESEELQIITVPAKFVPHVLRADQLKFWGNPYYKLKETYTSILIAFKDHYFFYRSRCYIYDPKTKQ